MLKIYKNPEDFRKSLEAKLLQYSQKETLDLQRLRRKIAFDRFLARIFSTPVSPFCLKGGYAMELTFIKSRTTKDIDLIFKETQNRDEQWIHMQLNSLAEIELGDYFSYIIQPPQKDLTNATYGGSRFPISARIGGREFVNFKIDVAMDVSPKDIRTLAGKDWLSFIDIPPPIVSMISLEQQFAEKIHAYTLPRDFENARVKDLIDLVLIIEDQTVNQSEVEKMLQKVFKIRNTHPIPESLPKPSKEWEVRYDAMAKECGIELNLVGAYAKIETYFNEIKTLESFTRI